MSQAAKKGYARTAHKVWDDRCTICLGTGQIKDIHGKSIPCPRCSDEDEQKLYEAGLLPYRRLELP